MTTALRFPDVERAAKDLLDSLTPAPVTVGVGVPDGFDKAKSPTHLQVSWDGTVVTTSGLRGVATIRVCAWAGSTTAAKAAGLDAHARLCAHRHGFGISLIAPGAGLLPATDVETGADLFWFTVLARIRSTPL